MIEVNSKAPYFMAKNQMGEDISLDSFRDKILILYFYPKDMTKGCTIEAKEFSSLFDEFVTYNCEIVGVSSDDTKSHIKFIQKEGLKHMLISDINHDIAKSYFVWAKKSMYGREYMGIIRSTFVIKNNIVVGAFYNVKSSNHASKILEFVKKL